jgi:hypothetical protein
MQDTLAWVQRKFPKKSAEEQQRFAQNIINKRGKSSTPTPQPQQTQNDNGIGQVQPGADPYGLLDGVTEIVGYERCGYDLFIAFYRGKNHERLDNIAYIAKRDDPKAQEMIKKYHSYPRDEKFIKKYWCVGGSIVEFRDGHKELQLYLS